MRNVGQAESVDRARRTAAVDGVDHVDRSGDVLTSTADRAERGERRRADILSGAAELFARRGYAGVGMDDIGAAAGITGPAIYRHFTSKAAVLAAVFDQIIATVAGAPPETDPASGGSGHTDGIVSSDDSPASACQKLALLIDTYAAAVAARRRLMAVFVREVHHLPPKHRSALDDRQRALIRSWRQATARVHPDWPAERVRTAVHGCFGLLNSVGTFDSPLDDDALAVQLGALARGCLAVSDAVGPAGHQSTVSWTNGSTGAKPSRR